MWKWLLEWPSLIGMRHNRACRRLSLAGPFESRGHVFDTPRWRRATLHQIHDLFSPSLVLFLIAHQFHWVGEPSAKLIGGPLGFGNNRVYQRIVVPSGALHFDRQVRVVISNLPDFRMSADTVFSRYLERCTFHLLISGSRGLLRAGTGYNLG
jgi:hypothetical protein